MNLSTWMIVVNTVTFMAEYLNWLHFVRSKIQLLFRSCRLSAADMCASHCQRNTALRCYRIFLFWHYMLRKWTMSLLFKIFVLCFMINLTKNIIFMISSLLEKNYKKLLKEHINATKKYSFNYYICLWPYTSRAFSTVSQQIQHKRMSNCCRQKLVNLHDNVHD